MMISDLIDGPPRTVGDFARLHAALAASGPVVHKKIVYAADGRDAVTADAILEERATLDGWQAWAFPYADDAHAAACLGLPLATRVPAA